MRGCVLTCQDGALVCEHVFAPLSLVHTDRFYDIPSVCILSAFCQVDRFVHPGSYGSHVIASTHHSLLLHLALVFVFATFSFQMEVQQNVRPPFGTTEWNHSYCTGNSLSAPLSVQQLQNGTISGPQALPDQQRSCPCLPSVTRWFPNSTFLICMFDSGRRSPILCSHFLAHKRTNGTASSGFVSSPQLPRSAISSQVPAGPTRNVTGEVMPLAEAVTPLSFLEFLQRCGLLIAPPQPHQIPVPISPLDAAMQTTSRSAASQDVSTQTCARPVSSSSLDVAVQTPLHSVLISPLDAGVQTLLHSNASQDVSTQMGARPASSFSLDAAVQTLLHCVLSHDTSTQLPLTEFFIGCIFSDDPLDCQGSSSVQCGTDSAPPPHPSDTAMIGNPSSSSLVRDGHAHTTAPHFSSHHRVSKSMPRLQVSRSLPTYALHMVY